MGGGVLRKGASPACMWAHRWDLVSGEERLVCRAPRGRQGKAAPGEGGTGLRSGGGRGGGQSPLNDVY